MVVYQTFNLSICNISISFYTPSYYLVYCISCCIFSFVMWCFLPTCVHNPIFYLLFFSLFLTLFSIKQYLTSGQEMQFDALYVQKKKKKETLCLSFVALRQMGLCRAIILMPSVSDRITAMWVWEQGDLYKQILLIRNSMLTFFL